VRAAGGAQSGPDARTTFPCRFAVVSEGTLDKNSPYAYLMFAQWFDKECMGTE
jgi:hypothetical protein